MSNQITKEADSYCFSPSRRILKSFQFQQVFKSGRCLRSRSVDIRWRQNTESDSRLGQVIPRKVGNAVVRNKLRRKVREAFRVRFKNSKTLDVVVSFKKPIRFHEITPLFERLEQDLTGLELKYQGEAS